MNDDFILVNFGERLRSLRKTTGFSQEALANQAQMHRTYLSGIERGERNVSLINIAKLAKALDTSVSELFRDLD